MNYRQYGTVFTFLICFPVLLSAMPDFGPDGLDGLNIGQLQRLAQGQIIITVSASAGERSELIEAAFLLDRPPEEVWEFLYRTEDQYLYLRETESSKALYKSVARDLIEYKVRVFLVGTTFWLVHRFERQAMYILGILLRSSTAA